MRASREREFVGVPVTPFPEWYTCSACQILLPLRSDLLELDAQRSRPDTLRYTHACKVGRPPVALPSRFVVACENGHLDDFPWLYFVHRGPVSTEGHELRLYEPGVSSEAADIILECVTCGVSRKMADAFGGENRKNLPPCEGRRPHLASNDPRGCAIPHVRAMLQGASGLWFAVQQSALAIPQHADPLTQLVEEFWPDLATIPSLEILEAMRPMPALKFFRAFTAYSSTALWDAIEKHRAAPASEASVPSDLREPEWLAFSNPSSAPQSRDFRVRETVVPKGYESILRRVVLVERLREVRALLGFTRIQSPRDFDSVPDIPEVQRAPLAARPLRWVPACEIRGEGIFLEFAQSAISEWEVRYADRSDMFRDGNSQWRAERNLIPDRGYPGPAYIALHTFAHALIRELCSACGYSSSSISERIYCAAPGVETSSRMLGILIYTGASDSEGTLGGLCAQGEPSALEGHLDAARSRLRICSSDPLCSDHEPTTDITLHAAACYSCSFLPETSCERSNSFLDRAALVDTLSGTSCGLLDR